MQFNDTTNKNGLIQLCELLLGLEDGAISGNSTLLKQFTGLINTWYRRVNGWIWNVADEWQYDDSNWTTLPIAVCSLVNNQSDYTLPSVAQVVLRVEVMDTSGKYQIVTPINEATIQNQSLAELEQTTGFPLYYSLVGNSLKLIPTPTDEYVTLTNGLRIWVGRDISEFDSTDTTAEPGFINTFHKILSLGAALDYCMAMMPDEVSRINLLKNQINELKEELENTYSVRLKSLSSKITPRRHNYS